MGIRPNRLAAILSQFSGSASAAPVVTHTQDSASTFGTNRTITLSHTPDSGKSLILLINCSADPGAWTVTDNQGNTYTNDFSDTSIANRHVYRAHNIANAPTTLQFNNPNSVIITVRVFEVSGLANASPSVPAGQTSGTSVATLTRSHTAAGANELVVGWMAAGATRITTSDVLPAGVTNVPIVGADSTFHGFHAVVPTAVATDFKQTFSVSTTTPRLMTVGYAAA